jgi:hypothetical protein
MTFFSAVMAPLVFTKLPLQTAGGFIRQVFPWYYLTMGAATLIALTAMLLGVDGAAGWEVGLTASVLVGFIYSRQVLMPQINRARDAELRGSEGAARRFARLHRISVTINGLQWLAVFAALVLVLL